MVNQSPTGAQYHVYINPEREIDAGAVAIHGLTGEFLADKPIFSAIADEFLDFIGDAPLVIHNAPFDMGFINAELALLAGKHCRQIGRWTHLSWRDANFPAHRPT